MRILDVRSVETKQLGPASVTIVHGVVQGRRVVVGDAVVLNGADGSAEPAGVSAVMSGGASVKVLDVAEPGDAVQLVLRRKTPAVQQIVSVDAAE